MTMRRTLVLANPEMRDGEDKEYPLDVTYVQKLLSNWLKNSLNEDFHPGPVDGSFGPIAGHAAQRAKYWYGYPKSECVPSAGQVLVNLLHGDSKMTPVMKWRRQFRLHALEKTLRQKLVLAAAWGARNRAAIHYSQGSLRMAAINSPYHLPLYTDCSAFVTLLYKWTGGPDPNGSGFNGLGYTGTMLAHCHPIAKSSLLPGDLVVWGYYPGHHVAMVVQSGVDPLLISHGQESDPRYVRMSAETASQAANGHGYVTCLRVPGVV